MHSLDNNELDSSTFRYDKGQGLITWVRYNTQNSFLEMDMVRSRNLERAV